MANEIETINGKAYFKVHETCARALGNGTDEETQEGRLNMPYHRRLCHATVNPILDAVATQSRAKEVSRAILGADEQPQWDERIIRIIEKVLQLQGPGHKANRKSFRGLNEILNTCGKKKDLVPSQNPQSQMDSLDG